MNLSRGIVNDCVKIVSLYFGEPLNSIPIESSQLYRCKNINYSLDFLKYLDKNRIAIGTDIQIMDKEPFDESMIIKINDSDFTISKETANNIYVKIN